MQKLTVNEGKVFNHWTRRKQNQCQQFKRPVGRPPKQKKIIIGSHLYFRQPYRNRMEALKPREFQIVK